MTTLLDLLHGLGAWSLEALWLPVLAWTLAALVVAAGLRLWKPHPLLGYRARQALLLALPLGLALAAVTDWTFPLLPAVPTASAVVLEPSVVGTPVAPQATPTLPDLAWTHALGALTLLASLLAAWRLARVAVSAARLLRLRRSLSGDVPPAVRETATETARRLGVRRRFRLACAPAGAAPMTLSFFRPVIALPTSLSEEELPMALAHELIHLRRRDDRAAWSEALVGAVFFAHPLCFLLRRRIDARREQAADAALLGSNGFSPDRYARLLYDLSGAPHASFALSLASPNPSLKNRLHAMKDYTACAPRLTFLFATLTLALPLLLMACSDLSVPTETDSAHERTAQNAAALDSLVGQSITALSVEKDGAEGGVLRVYVEAETTPETRDQLRRYFEQKDEFDRVVISDSPVKDETEAVERLLEGKKAEGGENKIQIPAPGMDERLSSAIETIGVRVSDDGRHELRIALKPGTPTAVREEIRAQLEQSHGDFEVVLVEASDAAATSSAAPVEFSSIEVKPKIIGGPQALYDAIEYPEVARADSIEGTVYLQFVVTAKGAVDQVEVLRTPAEVLSREAVRALKKQRFEPGRHDGAPVPVRMAQPIRFQLPS